MNGEADAIGPVQRGRHARRRRGPRAPARRCRRRSPPPRCRRAGALARRQNRNARGVEGLDQHVGGAGDELLDAGDADRRHQFERAGERPHGDRRQVGDGVAPRIRQDRVLEPVVEAGVLGTGPAAENRADRIQAPLAEGDEPAAPAGPQPLLPADGDGVGDGPVGVDHAEALDAVDDQQAVADDLADAGQVGAVARCGSRRR